MIKLMEVFLVLFCLMILSFYFVGSAILEPFHSRVWMVVGSYVFAFVIYCAIKLKPSSHREALSNVVVVSASQFISFVLSLFIFDFPKGRFDEEFPMRVLYLLVPTIFGTYVIQLILLFIGRLRVSRADKGHL
ncbi:hypothetical protein [Bdellovibrio sp. HCB209]|uniref:hypothetical protein n=1 Tax=Bdellovibrio sp. HCB209 TaxID=3394354 RepID=UPI0039B509B1